MNQSRQSRTKRGTFIINLVQTANGYSLIEGVQLLNKSTAQSTYPQPTAIQTGSTQNHPIQNLVQKQHRISGKRINLIGIRNQVKETSIKKIQIDKHQDNNKLITQKDSQKYAEWFNINLIHQKQQNFIIQWLTQENSYLKEDIKESMEYKNLLVQYKRQRNQIIKLYYKQYAPYNKFLTSNQIRKYICVDAYWLMKIHVFLNSWGIINSHNLNFEHQVNQQSYLLKLNTQTHQYRILQHQFLNHDLTHHPKNDQNQVLKKLTGKIRPYCDYCGIHCGIVWFQHLRAMDPKQISMIMKNVNSKNPPLSDKQYDITLCTRCYCDGHFPLLLTHYDFKKVSVNDKLQPNKKKKNKKKKQKSKKKRKQRQQQQFQQRQIIQSEIQKTPQQQIQKNKPQLNVNSVIQLILSSQQTQKKWQSHQILKLLELVQQYGQKWDIIHKTMQSLGYCQDVTPQELIGFFLNLPKKGISKIKQQYNHQQFLKDNYHSNATNLIDIITQKTLNKVIKINHQDKQKQINDNINNQQSKNQQNLLWKQSLNQFIRLYIQRTNKSINNLEKLESISKEKLEIVSSLYKKVQLKSI